VLVGGYTYSTNGRGVDGFVAPFDPTLTTLLHSTYIGGSGERDLGIAVTRRLARSMAGSPLDRLCGNARGSPARQCRRRRRLRRTARWSLTQVLSATYPAGWLDRIVAIAIHP
jgi:hypothetical protein